jgi:hypothetical protein
MVIRQAGSILLAEGQENVPGPAAARSELNGSSRFLETNRGELTRALRATQRGTSTTPNEVLAVPTWLCPQNSADVTTEPQSSARDKEDNDENRGDCRDAPKNLHGPVHHFLLKVLPVCALSIGYQICCLRRR